VYALLAYQTAYLKVKYPAEYYAAYLSVDADAGKVEKMDGLIKDARMNGITILPPDVNECEALFKPASPRQYAMDYLG